jgi:aminopeptidase N
MLHTIRQIVGNDGAWRGILRGLNRTFRHQTVMGRQIEDYISRRAGTDLSRVFDQYLRATQVPVLEYRLEGKTLSYRWANVVAGFDMPVRVGLGGNRSKVIHPTESWQTTRVGSANPADLTVDPNYYVTSRNLTPPAGN